MKKVTNVIDMNNLTYLLFLPFSTNGDTVKTNAKAPRLHTSTVINMTLNQTLY